MNKQIDELKTKAGSLGALADALGLSIGHTCDLLHGKRPVTINVAKRLSAVGGKAWHKYL